MIRILSVAAAVFMLHFTLAFAQPTKSPLISIPLNSFLDLPENYQVIYVAGAIDALTFMSYNYAPSDHDEYAECFRRQSLGEFTAEVVKLGHEQPDDYDKNVATLVAMTAGRLCR